VAERFITSTSRSIWSTIEARKCRIVSVGGSGKSSRLSSRFMRTEKNSDHGANALRFPSRRRRVLRALGLLVVARLVAAAAVVPSIPQHFVAFGRLRRRIAPPTHQMPGSAGFWRRRYSTPRRSSSPRTSAISLLHGAAFTGLLKSQTGSKDSPLIPTRSTSAGRLRTVRR
jgi:hypothetical protein